MTTWYINPASGNDSNDGLSWGSAKLSMKSVPTASIVAGDEFRFAKSEDPVACGSATWTDGSSTVTFSSPPTLASTDLLSRASSAWWDSTPWHGVASIAGSTVTLARPYRGPSGTFTTYRRAPVAITGSPSQGFGSNGQAAVSGTSGSTIKVSGGWNTSTGLQDGQTILDGQTTSEPFYFVQCHWIEWRRFSFVRAAHAGVGMLACTDSVFEIDNVIDGPNTGTSIGSGGSRVTATYNVLAGNNGDGVHIHTHLFDTVRVNKGYDNAGAVVSQNDDYDQTADNCSRQNVRIVDAAHNGAAIRNFNFIGGSSFTVDLMHDNGVGIRPDSSWDVDPDGNPIPLIDQSATFTIGDAYANGIDLDFSSAGGHVAGTMHVFASLAALRSTTPINYDPAYTTISRNAEVPPVTLNATNTSGNTTATTNADGTSLDFTANQTAEWSIDAGTGKSVILSLTFDASATTSADLTVDSGTADPIAIPVGSPMTTAHRTSGVAPLAVFFDAADVTPAAAGTQEYYASPYPWTSGVVQPSDMEGSLWSWDFGDSGAGNWATTGKAKNTATGYTAAHVYETPGTYTARLTVTDTAGVTRTYAQTITVSDPDVAFASTTKYVAANGSDSAAGTQAAPYLTIGRAMTDIANGVAKRVLLRRGDTFNVGTSIWNVTADGPGLIGAYGTGARPIITCSNTGFNNIITFTNSGTTWPTASGADWRVMDLDFNMTNGAASSASSVGPHNGGRTTANLLMLRVLARNFAVAFLWQTWDQWAYEHSNTGIFLVDCEGGPNVGDGSYGCYGGGYHSAWLGNNLHDNQNSGGTHILRIWQAHKCAISNNRLWRPGNNRHCLKLHSPSYRGDSSGPGNSQPGTDPANWTPGIRSHEPCTRWVNVTDNIVSGSSPAVTSMPASYVVSIGPQDSINEEWTSHIVYERNRHTGAGWVYTEVESSASHIVVRNNVFDATASTYSEYRGILFMRRGIEPSPTDMRVLNNTWYQGASRNECYVGDFDAVAGPVTTMRNNLFVYPGGSGFTPSAPWFSQPPATADHNLWSTAAAATIFTDAANSDLTLRAGSPAIDAGVVMPEVQEDFARVVRAGHGTSTDLGAYER